MGCDVVLGGRTAHVGAEGSFHCCAECQLARSSSACSPSTWACPTRVHASSCRAGLLDVSMLSAEPHLLRGLPALGTEMLTDAHTAVSPVAGYGVQAGNRALDSL